MCDNFLYKICYALGLINKTKTNKTKNTENRVILKVEFVDWIVELYSFVNG
jgi:hypothetical protein